MHVAKAQVKTRPPFRKGRSTSTVLLAFTLSCLASATLAQDDNLGAPVNVGDSQVYPSIRVDYIQNDNAFLTDANKKSASGVIASPSVVWKADKRTTVLTARYKGNYGKFSESALDYNDHSLGLGVGVGISKRLGASIDLTFDQGHEQLGTNLTRVDAQAYDEQVVFRDFSFNTRLRYGAKAAKGNVEVGLLYTDHTPETLKGISGATEYTLVQPSVLFSLRVSPDTRLLFEVLNSTYDYREDSRDRTDLTVLSGLQFSATGKLTGILKLGVTQSDYELTSRQDSSELFVDSNIIYVPQDQSRLNLRLKRDFDNDDGSSLSAVSDIIRLGWRYDWSERFYHRLSAGRTSTSRTCPDRGESTVFYGLEGNVKVYRWLEVGAGIYQQNGTGDSCPGDTAETDKLDYERQNIGVHVRATL